MPRLLASALLAFALLSAGPALAAEPLVDVAWLKANRAAPGVVLVDIRDPWSFQQGHIPGAVNAPYGGKKGWRVKKGEVRGMLPPTGYLEKKLSAAGVGNDSHMIVVAGGYGTAEMASATRVYWTMRMLGHDKVSILDGGLAAWVANKKNPLAKGPPPRPRPAVFKAKIDKSFLATAEDVRAAARTGALIDARPTFQFLGIAKSGSVTRYGAIDGARNLPALWLTRNDSGFFRGRTEIAKLYDYAKAPTADGTISYCNTGHWASLSWFVEYAIMGKKNAKMYDGSLAEWSRLKDAPMSAAVVVK